MSKKRVNWLRVLLTYDSKSIIDHHKASEEELTEQLTDSLSNILLGKTIPRCHERRNRGEYQVPANRKITKTLLRKTGDGSRSHRD